MIRKFFLTGALQVSIAHFVMPTSLLAAQIRISLFAGFFAKWYGLSARKPNPRASIEENTNEENTTNSKRNFIGTRLPLPLS
jgi:hypothetical protein